MVSCIPAEDSMERKSAECVPFFSFRWFMCWTWLQPSCTRWFWVLRRTCTPCSFAWRHTHSPTSPRWVRSCCWRRESPSTHADRPRTVCQRDWYVTRTHINIECVMSNRPSQMYIGSKRLLFYLHNWRILFLFWNVWLSLLLFLLFLVISKCLTQHRLLLQFLFYFIFYQCMNPFLTYLHTLHCRSHSHICSLLSARLWQLHSLPLR